jgi:hypothetical protein
MPASAATRLHAAKPYAAPRANCSVAGPDTAGCPIRTGLVVARPCTRHSMRGALTPRTIDVVRGRSWSKGRPRGSRGRAVPDLCRERRGVLAGDVLA